MAKLSQDAEVLLVVMRDNGVRPFLRRVTGRASYHSDVMGEKDCTKPLAELYQAGLVEIVNIDEKVGWFTYAFKEGG